MKCPICGDNYSDKVWRIHRTRCVPAEKVDTKTELLKRAEAEGVAVDKRWGKSRIMEALDG